MHYFLDSPGKFALLVLIEVLVDFGDHSLFLLARSKRFLPFPKQDGKLCFYSGLVGLDEGVTFDAAHEVSMELLAFEQQVQILFGEGFMRALFLLAV